MQEKKTPLLTLSMIVKDEEKTLARTLRSVKPYLDRWVILDTGSTDGTKELIQREMEGVPGELVEKPFVDFATTRNAGLDLAGEETEFVLWLDADDILENGKALRAFLEKERSLRGAEREAYYIRIDLGIRFDSPRILRSSEKWRFKGVVHEVLCHPDKPPPSIRIPDVLIKHERGEGSLDKSKKRWERDVLLLQKAVADDPNDTRSTFYLAQTLRWLERNDEAASVYERRIAQGGWAEEVYESKMALAYIAVANQMPWAEIEARYLEAHAHSPHRAEPLYAIAMHYNQLGKHALTYLFGRRGNELPYPKNDKLFVDEEVYAWKIADLVASSAYWIGEFEIGEQAAQKAVRARPSDARLRRNLEFYLDRKKAKKKGR